MDAKQQEEQKTTERGQLGLGRVQKSTGTKLGKKDTRKRGIEEIRSSCKRGKRVRISVEVAAELVVRTFLFS